MKKLLCVGSVLLCAFCLFVSCSSDVEETNAVGTCSASFRTGDDSKGLSVDLNNDLTVSGTDSFYWQYEAVKEDTYGTSGQTSTKTNINGSDKGLAQINNLSTGKWTFRLYAYVDDAFTKLIYKGEVTGIVLSADKVNDVQIEVDRVQTEGVKGTLVIDPARVQVGTTIGGEASSVVSPVSGADYIDSKTDSKIMGNLSDYSYTVYLCNDHFVEKSVLIDNRDSVYTTDCNSGTYYLKFRLSKDNDAVSYVGTLEVEIYDWCTTAITEGSGISVKYLKEFKIEYKDEGGSAFTGTHQKIDNGDGTFSEYPTAHQYGRAEELDEPTKTGFAFVGYYTDEACTNKITCVLPYVYEDTTVYAKWDQINYSSISWVDNFPSLSKAAERTAHTGGSASGNVGAAFTMPTSPTCIGYNFMGWYITDSSKIETEVAQPTKHNQEVVYTAKWEPITYTIKFDTNIQGKGFTVTKNENSDITAEYNLEDVVYDIESDTMGFLGWSTDSNWTSGAGKIIGFDGYVKNLTTVDKSTVTLYAIWSDYFVPLEYIRSYPSGSTVGPYINTGLVYGEGADAVSLINMDIEFAGVSRGDEVLCGSVYGGNYNLVIASGTGNNTNERSGEWRFYNGLNSATVDSGIYFEDQMYSLEVSNSTANGSYINVDGKRENTGANVTANGNSIYLFCINNGGTSDLMTDMRLYSSLMFSKTGDVVRKFVPCKLQTSVPVARSSDGTVHGTVGEIGLWDLKTNKFYPNAGSQRFYEPEEEVGITFKANGGNGEDRVQKVLKGTPEALHRNIFSKNNSNFLGWIINPDNKLIDYSDKASVDITEPMNLYAKWSIPTSWNLFGQVDWIESTGYESIDLGVGGSEDKIIELTYQIFEDKLSTTANSGMRAVVTSVWGKGGAGYFGIIEDRGRFTKKNVYYCLRRADNAQISIHVTVDECISGGDRNKSEYYHQFPEETVNAMYDRKLTAKMTLPKTDDIVVEIYDADDTSDVIFKGNAPIEKLGTYDETYTGESAQSLNFTLFGGEDANKKNNRSISRIYAFRFDDLITEVNYCNFVPAVLTADLTASSTVLSADGTTTAGNLKVYGGKNCYKGEAGMWDLVGDMFYPNSSGQGTLLYPTDEYLVRFDANGGLGRMENQIFSSSTTARLSENRFQRDGYEFIGWADLPDGNSAGAKWYSDARVLHPDELRNVTLFAQWREVSNHKPYVELNYIRNDTDGNAYINTGYRLGGNYGSFRYLVGYKHTVSAANYVLGSANASNCRTGVIGQSSISAGLNNNNTVKTYAITQSVGTKYDADFQSYGSKVDYVLGTTSEMGADKPYKWSETGNFGLFTALSADGTPNSTGKGTEIYYFKLYDDKEKLVRDMIPVMLTEDITASYDSQGKARFKGTLGMWDKCNDKFYANAKSTGYFVNDDIVSIVFNGNGGNGSMDNQCFVSNGSKIALNPNQFTGAGGARFIGWNTSEDGSGIWYSDEYTTNDWGGGTKILYAQWEKKLGDIDIDYFEPVNYAEGDGKAYIGTGIVGDATHVFSIGFMSVSNTLTYNSVFGICNNWIDLFVRSNGQLSGYGGGKGWNDPSASGTFNYQNHYICTQDYSVKGGTFTRDDGVSVTVSSGKSVYASDVGSRTYHLFRHSNNDDFSGIGTPSYMRIYNFRIKNADDSVMLHLIPCRLVKKITSYVAGRISADQSVHKIGEVGFWDLVENKFYSNAGTGEFTCELN